MIQQPLQWRRFCACYGHPTDTTTTSDRTAAISGTKPWLPKFTDLLLPIIMVASLTLLVTPQMLLATDRLTCTLVKLTTVAVKMATVGLLGPDALIYSITYNARIHNLIHSVCEVRFPKPLGKLKLYKKNLPSLREWNIAEDEYNRHRVESVTLSSTIAFYQCNILDIYDKNVIYNN